MRRGLLALAGVLLALLILGQLVLPGYASRRLASDLERHGTGVHVKVSAFPAVKLLVHRADRVTVSVARLRSGGAGSGTSVADLLARTKATGDLDVDVGVVDDGRLRMHDVRLRKRGDQLTGSVALRRADVDAALPRRLRVSGRSLGGDRLTVAGRTSVFGRRVAARPASPSTRAGSCCGRRASRSRRSWRSRSSPTAVSRSTGSARDPPRAASRCRPARTSRADASILPPGQQQPDADEGDDDEGDEDHGDAPWRDREVVVAEAAHLRVGGTGRDAAVDVHGGPKPA